MALLIVITGYLDPMTIKLLKSDHTPFGTKTMTKSCVRSVEPNLIQNLAKED